MSGKAWIGWSTACACIAALAAPSVASAGVVTVGEGVARFTDSAGAKDVLVADLQFEDQVPSVDPPGWSLSFLAAGTELTPGAGCEEGFVGAICALGANPPAAVVMVLGGGDDELQLGVEPEAASATTRISIAGGAGADRILTVRARAEVDGGAGDDVIAPDERFTNDELPGLTPGGVIRGGSGVDVVGYENALDPVRVSLDGVANDGRSGENDNVHPDVENIAGGPFGDRLTGGESANRIEGGAGDDSIVVLDASGADQVACGAGSDVVFADAGDAVASDTCERRRWAPALAAGTLRYRGGRIGVRLSCPTQSTARCAGTVRLGTKVTLAAGGYRVKPGKHATLRLPVTRGGRKALRRTRSLRAKIVIRPSSSRGAVGRAVTVRR